MAVRPNGKDDEPQFRVNIDREKARAHSLSIAAINETMSAAWGSMYVNDFNDQGRVKRVYLQGNMDSRLAPEDFDKWYVRNQQRSEEHTSELQSLMRISYAVFCLKKKKNTQNEILHLTRKYYN